MTGYAFGLITPRQFLEKARREVGRLAEITWEMSMGSNIDDIQDTAINAALTIWHVSDWIANSTDQNCVAAIERIKIEQHSQKTNSLQILRDFILQDSHMVLCSALANGAKHLTLHAPPKFDASRVLPGRMGDPYDGTATVEMRSDVTVMPMGITAMPPMFFAKIRINDESVPALDVFHAALEYWDQFFAEYLK